MVPSSFLPSSFSNCSCCQIFRPVKLKVMLMISCTVISVNASDHQKVLSHLDSCCHDLGFTIRSDKCFSLIFDGQQAAKESTFIVGGGRTSNIHEHHTTFLGSIVAHSSRHTTKIASQLFLEAFTSSLNSLFRIVFESCHVPRIILSVCTSG